MITEIKVPQNKQSVLNLNDSRIATSGEIDLQSQGI